MAGLLFGTGGTPHSSRKNSTPDGIRRIAELGLGCIEIEFVQGVRMKEATAHLVRETANQKKVRLSAHAPYFINLNAREPEKIKASQDRLIQTARIGKICGAESIAFHTAFYGGDPPETVYAVVKKCLGDVLACLKQESNQLWIRPEIMGRPTQFGTIEEVLSLSTELERMMPCIDFAHWHARTGKFNSYRKFASVLEQVKARLGEEALKFMHIHVSGIAYGKQGEKNHLNFKESDFNYTEFLKALKDYGAAGFIVCESPNLEEDAMLLQETYHAL